MSQEYNSTNECVTNTDDVVNAVLCAFNKSAIDLRRKAKWWQRESKAKELIKSHNMHQLGMDIRRLALTPVVKRYSGANSFRQSFDSELSENNRVAVYTAQFGSYDKIIEPAFKYSNVDYYLFTDADVPINSLWKKVVVGNNPELQLLNSQKKHAI